MPTALTRSARRAFAALVAAGLTFGAGSVLASPTPMAACPYNPDSSQYGISCTSHQSCTSPCTFYSGIYSEGRCYSGCCTCLV
jgi:hypothetical protein